MQRPRVSQATALGPLEGREFRNVVAMALSKAWRLLCSRGVRHPSEALERTRSLFSAAWELVEPRREKGV